MINTRSIQFRLILWYSSLIVVVSTAFGAYVYSGVENRLYSDLRQTLSRRAHNIATDILPRLQTVPSDAVRDEIHEIYSPEAADRFIRITQADGAIFYQSSVPSSGAFDPAMIPRAPMPQSGHRIVAVSPRDHMLIVATSAQAPSGTFIVEMGALTGAMDSVLERLITMLLVGLPLVVLTVGAGGYALVRRSLQPVEQLRATAQQLTFQSSGSQLPVVKTGDAIEHLAVTLNQMLERLGEAYQQANRFSADASHELRTPLTILRSELESLLRRDNMLSEPIRDRVASVLEEAERLSEITEGLFSLSRLEAGEAKMRDVTLDLAKLVQTTVEQMQLLADEKKIRLVLETSESVWIVGDPARLKQIVVDLLDNAIKYTPPSGQVLLRVFAAGKRAVMEVSDTGIGISKEALPHVFERFYRADAARSRQVDGAGLGLSIVRAICHAHGGDVEIESAEGQGTTCRVQLPMAA